MYKFLSKSKQPLFVKLDVFTPYAEATEGVSLGQCAQWHCGFSPSGGGAVSRGHHQTQGTTARTHQCILDIFGDTWAVFFCCGKVLHKKVGFETI